jgi:transposase-like protein
VHFLRNALDYVPRKVDDDCLKELRWMYDRRDLAVVNIYIDKLRGKVDMVGNTALIRSVRGSGFMLHVGD